MERTLPLVSAILAVATAALAQGPTVIHSTIASSPTSLIPGGGGIRFISIDRPNVSANGKRWITIAKCDSGVAGTDDVLVVGADATSAFVLREGVTEIEVGRTPVSLTSDRRCSVRNDGMWAYALDLSGSTTDNQIVLLGLGTGWSIHMREGEPVSSVPGATWGASINEAQVIEDWTLSVRATLVGVSTANDTGLFAFSGGQALAREGITIPTGQQAPAQVYASFGFNSFTRSAFGASWTAIATLAGPAGTDTVAVRNNAVLVQEGVTIPGLGAPVAVIYGRPMLGGNDDVFVSGWTTNGAPETFVTLNGGLLAKAGDAVGGGLPGEVWDTSVWNTPAGKGFFLHTSDNAGNNVIGGFTNAAAPAGENFAVTYNGSVVILRGGDPVDVDGNGLFDDDAFCTIPAADLVGASLDNRIEDGWLSSDGWFYKVIKLRNAAGASLGQALVRRKVPGPPPVAFCFGDGSGTPCPCSPAPVPHGAPGKGCPTNVFAGGAQASASGVSSIAADSLVLTATDMINGSMIFYQGTTQQSGGAGAHFGDGKRCIQATSIRRFKTKTIVGNTASYPGAGDAKISVAGLVGAPGVAHYQGWYRSANPTFCTAATFNLTNGVTITWIP